MARTTTALVQAVIEEYNSAIPLIGPIRTAHALTNYVDAQDIGNVLNTDLLLEIETYLAAHFYAQAERAYTMRTTGRSSGVFEGKTDMGLRNSHYGQQALALDVTGTLAAISNGVRRMTVTWLGREADSERPDNFLTDSEL